jgi:hypothetical protein
MYDVRFEGIYGLDRGNFGGRAGIGVPMGWNRVGIALE